MDENLLRELIVLDTGGDFGYILNVDFVRHYMYCDPLTIFAQCRHFLLFCQSDAGLWKREMAEKYNIEKAINSRMCLTDNERKIIRALHQGHSVKSIVKEINISEKTVSVHKINALSKMGLKSLIVFYTEYRRWAALWIQLILQCMP